MLSILEALFSSAARVQVLHLFLLRPDGQFYQREIERETGQPIQAVQREVKRLEEVGLLAHATEGNRIFYRLNPEFPLLAELTALLRTAAGVEQTAGPPRLPPEPPADRQPFSWMEASPTPPLPPALRRVQVDGEWDRAY